MATIKICRSFSKKKQVGAFEPIDAFCSVEAEFEENEIDDQKIISLSGHLDKLVRQEVERTIENEMAKVEAIKKKNTF
jgi:hypothetical protein